MMQKSNKQIIIATTLVIGIIVGITIFSWINSKPAPEQPPQQDISISNPRPDDEAITKAIIDQAPELAINGEAIFVITRASQPARGWLIIGIQPKDSVNADIGYFVAQFKNKDITIKLGPGTDFSADDKKELPDAVIRALP